MKRSLFLVCLLPAALAQAQTFYNGDFDGVDAIPANSLDDNTVYDDAAVLGPTVVGIWGNFLVDVSHIGSMTALKYEFRQGVSAGHAGTLLASGAVANFTRIATGRTWQNGGYAELQLSGDVNIRLTPGTYTLGLQAASGPAHAFLAETHGGNAGPAGDPNPAPTNSLLDQNSYLDTAENGSPFPYLGLDFSIGLTTVPEPTPAILLALGCIALARRTKTRRRL